MLNVLITSLFLVSYVRSNGAEFLNVSSRIAVVAGSSAELVCDTSDGSDVQYWDHSSLANGSWSWTRIFNGWDIGDEFRSNINFTRNVRGKWILQIALVNTRSSGYYKCVTSEQTDDTILTSEVMITELIVFASDPQCNISQDVFKEAEDIYLWCNLKYFGSMAPVMEWTKNGTELDEAIISNGITYNVSHTDVTSTVLVKADSSLHKSIYSCKCYYKQSCNETYTLKCKVPEYQYTWTSPIILVKYSSRNIDIVPWKKVFHPSDTVTCTADGYPVPDYKWIKLGDKSSQIQSGPILNITSEMKQDTEYVYECSASSSENDVDIRRSITFTVKASFSILTVTTTSTVVMSILLLFAILIIIKLGMQRRVGNRQPVENNADVRAGSDDSQNTTELRDDRFPSINVEVVSSSSESNAYDDINEQMESENQEVVDTTVAADHLDAGYMELHERDPVIPSVYTRLEATEEHVQ